MSGLKKEILPLNEEDKTFIANAKLKKLAGLAIAATATILILYYALFEYYYSMPMLFMSSLFMLLSLLNVYIFAKEYRMLRAALMKGEKDVFRGIVLTKYSKEVRDYRTTSWDYYVVLKDDPDFRKQRKEKIKDLKERWLKNEDEEALDEYEKTIAEGNDNPPIKLKYEEYEQMQEASKVEFHCLSSVYLGSTIFRAGTSVNDEIGYNNYFKLRLVIDNKEFPAKNF